MHKPLARSLTLLALSLAGTLSSHAALTVTNGLALWLDAGRITGLASGAVVNQWPDATLNTNHALRTFGNPLFVTNAVNGLPVVRFDGTDDNFNFRAIANARTVFWVLKESATASANWRSLICHSTANTWHRGANKTYWSGPSSGGFGQPVIYNGITWQNGVPVNGQTATVPTTYAVVALQTTADAATDQLGRDRTFADRAWVGDFAEILVFTRVLNAAEMDTVGRYLADKYAVAGYGPATVNPATFAHRRRLTFPGYAGTTALTNFPVLVKFADGGAFRYSDCAAPATGGDLRFGLDGTHQELLYDVDEWNTNGVSYVWVSVPALTRAATIWAYWGNPAATARPYATTAGLVWDRADYAGVYHLKEAGATTAHADNSPGANTLTNAASAAEFTGIVGRARAFANGNAQQPASRGAVNGGGLTTAEFTVMVWERTEVGTHWRDWWGMRGASDTVSCRGELTDAAPGRAAFYNDGMAGLGFGGGGRIVENGGWHQVVVTASKRANKTLLYVDGVADWAGSTNTTANAITGLKLGAAYGTRTASVGCALDEARFEKVARPADWVRACYDTVARHDTFTAYGDSLNAQAPTAVGRYAATINGTLAWTNAPVTQVYLCWGTADAGASATGAWEHVTDLGAYAAATSLTYRLTGLAPLTTYYHRLFATSAAGTAWSQGNGQFRTRMTDAAGLALWLDAAALPGAVAGQPVATWPDQSGNGRDATAWIDATRNPTYVTNALGGRPALRFDGANDGLGYDGSFLVGADYTVFLVEARRSLGVNYALAGNENVANRNLHIGYRANNIFTCDHYANGYDMSVPLYEQPTPKIYAQVQGASGFQGRRTYVNGSLLGADGNTTTLLAYHGAALASRLEGGFYNGDIAEVLMFTRALTVDEQHEVGQYLAAKYGIASIYGDILTVARPDFAHSLDFTCAGYTGTEVLTNFPVLVKLGETLPNFRYTQFASAQGWDLRFTLKGTTNVLAHEIDDWAPAGTSPVWVRIPAFTNNTTITAYWGNPSLAGAAPYASQMGGTWEPAHRGVWHLKESGFPYTDSVLTRHGTLGAQPDRVAGLIGAAQDFNGTTHKIDVPYSALLNPARFTLSCWAKVEGGQGAYRSPATSRGDAPQRGYMIYAANNNFWTAQVGAGAAWTGASGPAVGVGQWAHVVFSYDGANEQLTVNGMPTAPIATALALNAAYPLRIGAGATEGAGNYWFNGIVDEVRVASVAQSADWNGASYANVNNYAGFVTPGAVSGPPPAVTNLAATAVADVTATAHARLVAAVPAQVTLYWGRVDGGTGGWQTTNALGSLAQGAVSGGLVGLAPATTYYYTFRVSNVFGAAWATPSASFTTRQTGAFAVTPSAGPNGAISPATVEYVNAGADSAVYTFVPDTGYHLTNVVVDGSLQGALPDYRFTNVQAAHTIQALFGINMYTITVTQAAGGTIAPDPAVVAHGGTAAFTIAPDPGSYLVDVKVDGVTVGRPAAYTFGNVIAPHALSARFAAYPQDFPPTNNLAFWLQADKLDLTNGAPVERWYELTRNDDLIQPYKFAKPIFATNAINGLPVVRYSDDTQTLSNRVLNADWPRTAASIWIVQRSALDGLNAVFMAAYADDAVNRFLIHLPYSNGNVYWDLGNINAPSVGRVFGPNGGTTSFNLWNMHAQPGYGMAIRKNAATLARTTATGVFAPGTKYLRVGAPYRGDIAEVLVFNRGLTEADENRVGYYLEQKYGLITGYMPPASADLRLAMTQTIVGPKVPAGDGENVAEGGVVAWTIVCTNAGPTNAAAVVVTDRLPPQVTFQSASSGAYDPVSGAWTIGSLAVHATTSLTVTVTANAGAGRARYVNTATVTASSVPDDSAANSTAAQAFTIWHTPLAEGEYQYRMPITFPGYKGTTTLTNFPALVVFSPATPGFSYAGFRSKLGNDLRFTASDGATVLAHEIEQWNPDGASHVWVRLPALAVGTTIWAHWGRSESLESWNAPAEVPGCVLWLKADAGVQRAGFAVTNWLDQSGAGHHLVQTNAAQRPLFESAVAQLGGLPAVRFNGSGAGQGFAPADLGIAEGADRTVVMVVIPEAGHQNSELLGVSTGQNLDFGTFSVNGRLRARNATPTEVNLYTAANTLPYDRPHVVEAGTAGGAALVSVWSDGARYVNSQATTAFRWALTAVNLGRSDMADRSYFGRVAELAVFNRTLTDAERNKVGQYLAMKYGLATRYGAPAFTWDGTVYAGSNYKGAWHLNSPTVGDACPTEANGQQLAPVAAAGLAGGALAFVNDEVRFGTRPSLSGAGGFTASAWIKTTAAANGRVVSQRDASSTVGQWVLDAGPTTRAWIYDTAAFDLTQTTKPVNDGLWHQVAFVRAGDVVTLYVDGVAQTNRAGAGKALNAGIGCGIGRDIRDNNTPFAGTIDQVEIADAARSPDWLQAQVSNLTATAAFTGSGTVQGLPALTNLAPTVVAQTTATLNGYLLSDGGAAARVWVLWGTADAQGVRSAWGHTNLVAATAGVGALAQAVTPLTAGTTYYYRYYASNSVGTVWAAPTRSFRTAAAGEFAIAPLAGPNGAVSPAAVAYVTAGQSSPVYTFQPATGYSLTNVLADGVSVGTPASYQFNNVQAAHSLKALFGPRRYTIAITQSAGGTLAPAPAQTLGLGEDSQTFAITPAAGYYVQDVIADGQSQGPRLTYQFQSVMADHTLRAVFGQQPVLPVRSGLAMWLAADAAGLTAGVPLGSWQDLSGNGRHATQAVSGSQPVGTLASSALLNGQPAVRFDGVNDLLGFDGTFLVNTDYTIFIVEGRTSNKAAGYMMGGSVALAQSNLILGYRANTTLTHAHFANDYDMTVAGYTAQAFNVLVCRLDSAGRFFRDTTLNGRLLGHNAVVTKLQAFVGAAVGGAASSGYYAGDLAEVIIYNRALTGEEHRQVGRYLAVKYALSTSYPVVPAQNAIIPQPEMWVAADALAGLSDGDVVPTWPDLSGNNRHWLKAAGSPLYRTGQLNGRPVVRFDGTDPCYLSFPQIRELRTVFWVLKEEPLATGGPRFLLGDPGVYPFHRSDGRFLWHPVYAPLCFNGTTELNGAVVNGTTTLAPTTYAIVSVRTSGNATASNFVNDRNIAARSWFGDLAELMAYTRVLTEDEENRVGAYLAAKYGITSKYEKPGTVLILR